MNAHVSMAAAVTATLEWFADLCDHRAGLYIEGVLSLQEATDELEAYARLARLNSGRNGCNTTQHIMAMAFGAPSLVPDIEQFDFEVGDIVRRWELADSRDRWKWTGEAPPKCGADGELHFRRQPYSTPQSTEDTFWYVVRNESGEYLKSWLARHPSDAAFLLNLWKQKNARQAATV